MSVHYVDGFMRVALREAERALEEGEVPVGCVLVRREINERVYGDSASPSESSPPLPAPADAVVEASVAARGRNQTNVLRHALAHAEFVAAQQLLSLLETNKESAAPSHGAAADSAAPRDLSPFVLYVTVEPCVMCGAMLLYNGIHHVFFGCRNPRFGGNGTVLTLQHEPPLKQPRRHGHRADGERMRCASSHADCSAAEESQAAHDATGMRSVLEPAPQESWHRATLAADPDEKTGTTSEGVHSDGAQLHNMEEETEKKKPWWPGYASEGGHREEEAVALLQRFYERENPNAPGHKRRLKPAANANGDGA